MPAKLSEAVIGFGGTALTQDGVCWRGEEPKSVIDSERRRLKCLRPAKYGGTRNRPGKKGGSG